MSTAGAALVAVIPILVGPKLELGLSAIGAEIGAAAAWRPRVRLIETEELFVRDPGAGSSRLENCGSDGACLAEELARFDVTVALLVVVNSEVEPPLIALRALDVAKREIVAQELGASGASLPDTVRIRAARLFDALGFTEAGRIAVSTETEGAEVSVDPAPIDAPSPRGWWVAPGSYRITAAWPDRRAAAEVVVRAGEEREVALDPIEAPSLVESPWLWVGVAAGVVAVAAGIVIATRSGGDDVCLGPPGTPCP